LKSPECSQSGSKKFRAKVVCIQGQGAFAILVLIHKWLFCPISASDSNLTPRNIAYIPVVKIFTFFELEQNIKFLNIHYLQNRIKQGNHTIFPEVSVNTGIMEMENESVPSVPVGTGA